MGGRGRGWEGIPEHERLKVEHGLAEMIVYRGWRAARARATTIDDPVFGFDPARGHEIEAHAAHGVDMMTVDNLPNELPRDASESFGNQLIAQVIPEFLKERSEILERATVAVDGQLGEHFNFLTDYISANIS